MNYFFQNFIDTVKNFSFKGRATRKQYWLFVLAQFLILILFSIVFMLPIVISAQQPEEQAPGAMMILIGIIFTIYTLATFIQNLAITTRRLHDANLSGWWQLIMFIPYLGNIILFFLTLLPSKNENNRFNTLTTQN